MKRVLSCLWLAGLSCLVLGCQPDTGAESSSPSRTQRAEALTAPLGAWSPTGPKVFPSTAPVLLRATGEVLDPSNGGTQRYNPYANTWSAPSFSCPQGYCDTISTVALPSGDVLAMILHPGRMGGQPVVKRYAPATDTWSYASVPYNRGSATLLDSGRVLYAGGIVYEPATGFLPTALAYEYDPETDTAVPVGSMTSIHAEHTATRLYSGQVLVVGGTFPDTAELYDPATRTWTAVPPVPHPRWRHLAVRLYSGSVMVLGGAVPGDTLVDVYDPYNARWSAGPSLPFPDPTSATLLYSGEVLAVNDAGQAALYSPSHNAWLPAASASATRTGGAVLLHSGQVLRTSRAQGFAEVFTR